MSNNTTDTTAALALAVVVCLVLALKGETELLLGEAVERRHRQLAAVMGKIPEISRS